MSSDTMTCHGLYPANTVWLAYHLDWSNFALFGTEIEALRYAVDNSMRVQAVTLPWSQVDGQLDDAWK